MKIWIKDVIKQRILQVIRIKTKKMKLRTLKCLSAATKMLLINDVLTHQLDSLFALLSSRSLWSNISTFKSSLDPTNF